MHSRVRLGLKWQFLIAGLGLAGAGVGNFLAHHNDEAKLYVGTGFVVGALAGAVIGRRFGMRATCDDPLDLKL